MQDNEKHGQEPVEGNEGRGSQHFGARHTGGNVGQRQRSRSNNGMSQEGHDEQSNGREQKQRRREYCHLNERMEGDDGNHQRSLPRNSRNR